MNKKKKNLMSALKDKAYREAFVSELINTGIPFQILALREQRELTQEQFGTAVGMSQEMVSRIEDPNYGTLTLKTLKKIASGLDIGLMVRFVPFSELVEWEANITHDALKALSFNNDPYFKLGNISEKDDTPDRNEYIPDTANASSKVVSIKEYKELSTRTQAHLANTARSA